MQTPLAVGSYWDEGLSSVCFSGFAVAQVERTCRPAQIGSERVVSVVLADDPSVVIVDASGPGVDPTDLEVGTPVVVRVATGRPCG